MRRLRRFLRDRRGVSAIEFAIIAPVLIMAYFGVAELCAAMLADRKTAHAAYTIGDLAAQYSTLPLATVTDIFSAGDAVMTPDSTTGLNMRITCVQADPTGTIFTYSWSESDGLPALTGTVGNAAQIATLKTLIGANQSIIMSEAQYTYTSPVAYLLPSAFTYYNVYYFRPRVVDPIPTPS